MLIRVVSGSAFSDEEDTTLPSTAIRFFAIRALTSFLEYCPCEAMILSILSKSFLQSFYFVGVL